MPPKPASKEHNGKESDKVSVLPIATYQSQLNRLRRDDLDKYAGDIDRDFDGQINPSQFKKKEHLCKKIAGIYRDSEPGSKCSMIENLIEIQRRRKKSSSQKSTALPKPSAKNNFKQASERYQCATDTAGAEKLSKEDVAGKFADIGRNLEKLKRDVATLGRRIEQHTITIS